MYYIMMVPIIQSDYSDSFLSEGAFERFWKDYFFVFADLKEENQILV